MSSVTKLLSGATLIRPDGTEPKITRVAAYGRSGERHKGEWMKLSPDEAELIHTRRGDNKLNDSSRVGKTAPVTDG